MLCIASVEMTHDFFHIVNRLLRKYNNSNILLILLDAVKKQQKPDFVDTVADSFFIDHY